MSKFNGSYRNGIRRAYVAVALACASLQAGVAFGQENDPYAVPAGIVPVVNQTQLLAPLKKLADLWFPALFAIMMAMMAVVAIKAVSRRSASAVAK